MNNIQVGKILGSWDGGKGMGIRIGDDIRKDNDNCITGEFHSEF